jgi:SAM-dependent methyltransferase
MTAPVPTGPCELCDATEWRPHLAAVRDYITNETFDLERCANCDLVVTCPMPPEQDLGRYYPARYRTDRQKQTGGWRVRRRAAMIAKQFPKNFRGRILDLGCGTGAFAMEMQGRGWTVAVTELDDAVLDGMRARGMEARSPADALRDGFSDKFDAITAWHVLEHVPRPRELAEWSRRNLKPGGVFQATVPNLDSWQAQRYGRQWLHLDVPRHLYHFTPATLRALLDKAGLPMTNAKTFALEYDLFGVIQSSLNQVCEKPNVLFERLTAKGEKPPASPRDVKVSYALSPFLGAYGLTHSLLAWSVGKGGTLTATCRLPDIS